MWRLMTSEDTADVFALAERVWGDDYYESSDTFLDKQQYYPAGCWVYDDQGIKGYIISHPWKYGTPPILNSKLNRDTPTDSYHIHDVVLDDLYRGCDIIERIPFQPFEGRVTLIAVNNTNNYWARKGFKSTDVICSYGTYMMKRSNNEPI